MDLNQVEMMVIEQGKQIASLENICSDLKDSVENLADTAKMHQTAIDKMQGRQHSEDDEKKVRLTKEGWMIIIALSFIDVASIILVHFI